MDKENCCHHHHEHGHHHHHATTIQKGMEAKFIIAIIINLLFVGMEYFLGIVYNSVGLIADAGHNLSDIGGLAISLAAIIMHKKSHTPNFTYGFKKATILASLINAVVLLAVVGFIIYESIEKIISPAPSGGWAIIITAGVGIIVNGFTVFLLSDGSKDDLNIKGAYLHMLADTLVSLGVVVAGVVILLTDWVLIDPIIGLVIGLIILIGSKGLLCESVKLVLDGTPEAVNFEEIFAMMKKSANVLDVHHVHVWALSTTENALTAHVVLADVGLLEQTKKELKELFKHYNINHSTLEFESPDFSCEDHCS
ncbi:MAG: cation transporter [Lentisphaeria bacterium]|nr:cation transporter [Lentisphaeria bacterium]